MIGFSTLGLVEAVQDIFGQSGNGVVIAIRHTYPEVILVQRLVRQDVVGIALFLRPIDQVQLRVELMRCAVVPFIFRPDVHLRERT